MIKRVEIKRILDDPHKLFGQDLTVCGWAKTIRDSKSLGFIELNDGSCFKNLQIVFEEAVLPNFEEIRKASVNTAFLIKGTLKSSPNEKQVCELHAKKIEIEGASDPSYPLQKKRHSFEYLRTVAHLRPRTNTFYAAFRVRSAVSYAIHRFFQERGFVYAHAPIITASDCEGAGEMFRTTTLDLEHLPRTQEDAVDYKEDFFGKASYLTVSGQLNAECMALAYGKVYTFGPTFRAENSNTSRHAAEFWMIEPEIAFADLQDDMQLASDMIKYVLSHVLETCPDEMEFFNRFIDKGLLQRISSLTETEYGCVTYTEAVRELEKVKDRFEYPVFWGCDLQTEHERFLTEELYKKPVFVIDYPKEIKSFYMRLNDDRKTVAAMDLLVPGIGEIIGGSQREERYDYLIERMQELGLRREHYEWYLDLRRYGSVRHAGFGLGLERLLMYVTGISNIRDVLPFPRTAGSADF